MWKLFFEVCYFLCWLIPIPRIRKKMHTEQLYDWKNKYRALKKKYPELNFYHTKMIKGGWNIGFIVDKKYVFKIRKAFKSDTPAAKIMHEKRITDAFAGISPLRIPHIEIIKAGKYTFYKYDFIPGKNLTSYSLRTILRHKKTWAKQLAKFIYAVHNSRPTEIADLQNERPGDGWNHNDICNNILVDKKTMKIAGIIDWEYSGWGNLETEFNNTVKFSKKMKKSGMLEALKKSYNLIKK